MDVLLVPGLWLDASSWDAVVPALVAAGHTPRAMTLPGVGGSGSTTADISLRDWVDAVVAEIDRSPDPVAVVGHSGGGNVIWGAVDARPDRVARAVFVDAVPPPPGAAISEFPVVDAMVPFPGWTSFANAEIWDLNQVDRDNGEARMRPIPVRIPTDEIELRNDQRHRVPVTILSGAMNEETLREELAAWGPWGAEFAAITDTRVITLGTGHWPQLSQPSVLAAALVDALG